MALFPRVFVSCLQNICFIRSAQRPALTHRIWPRIQMRNDRHQSIVIRLRGNEREIGNLTTQRRFVHISSCLLKTKAKKVKKMEVIIDPKDVEEILDLNEVLADITNVVEKLKRDYMHSFRVGAHVKLLDQIKVPLDGDEFALREVAMIHKKSEKALELDFVSFPEALPAAEVAIQSSGLNLNPSVKGTKMALHIPAVTGEHRRILVKAAKQRMNDAKDQIRKVRNHHEKALGKIEHLPEDTDRAIKKQIGIYVNASIKESEDYFKMKEKDLLLK